MNRLTEIGCRLGTDKADYHEFTEFYQEYFEKFYNPTILEIGILEGASLRMYDEFFNEKAKIFGVDIADKSYLSGPGFERIKTIQGDILRPDTLDKIRAACPSYDIIIDDGGHTMEQQQKALLSLWPLLKAGGLFIMEDLHTSRLPQYNPDNSVTTLDLISSITENDASLKESIYIRREDMLRMSHEMDTVQVWTKDWPTASGESPRASITAVIQKQESFGIHPIQ